MPEEESWARRSGHTRVNVYSYPSSNNKSIEAMKMESMLRAERDCVIKAIHVIPGDAVAAKDLLLELG